jgi:hypothetical protein
VNAAPWLFALVHDIQLGDIFAKKLAESSQLMTDLAQGLEGALLVLRSNREAEPACSQLRLLARVSGLCEVPLAVMPRKKAIVDILRGRLDAVAIALISIVANVKVDSRGAGPADQAIVSRAVCSDENPDVAAAALAFMRRHGMMCDV